jgi:hypothetical protein
MSQQLVSIPAAPSTLNLFKLAYFKLYNLSLLTFPKETPIMAVA